MRRDVVPAMALLLVAGAGCDRRAHAGDAPATSVTTRANDAEAAAYAQYRQPEKIVAGLELAPGMRVADVGAGRGLVTARIADAVGAGGHVVATDIDAAALGAIARRDAIETRVVRADEPGLEAGVYDRILVAEVDHYLPDRAAYLAKLARALAPGGFIAVTNRVTYRDAVVAAARQAGLQVTEAPLGLPAHFFVRLNESTPSTRAEKP